MKKLLSFVLPVTFIALLFWGCEKRGDPPALPPAESMVIDFSEFIAGTKSASFTMDNKSVITAEKTNWIVAASVAIAWTSKLVETLAIPVAAFHVAVENEPDYLDNRKWQWKYNVPVLGATYTARLTGQILATEIKWEMYISREGVSGFGEFLWFEGTTALDGNSGQWILTQSQKEQVPVLQIDWIKEGAEIGTIKYTYIKEGDPFKDSFIEYGLTSNTFNAFYNVHFWEPNRAKFLDVLIEWSTSSHTGRIKAVDFFQDNSWHCWNELGIDIACP